MTSRRIILIALVATVLLAGAALAVAAANAGYTLDWFTVDGGGGTATGGNYTVSGTIGQPDAGTLTGGAYTVRGGFWGGLAVNTSVYLPLVRR